MPPVILQGLCILRNWTTSCGHGLVKDTETYAWWLVLKGYDHERKATILNAFRNEVRAMCPAQSLGRTNHVEPGIMVVKI